jgi:hypothetical protein
MAFKFIGQCYRRLSAWMDYNPPGALSSKGWRLFKDEFKERAPIRYWIREAFREYFWPIKHYYEEIRAWIYYRFTNKCHLVNSGLKPGWHEIEELMLHTNFSMLKNFVEVEQARHTYWFSEDGRKKASWFEKHMPFYRFFYPFRRPDLGIVHLQWAATLDDPSLPPYQRSDAQAIAAREILALYKWWTIDRPSRKEIELPDFSDQGLGILSVLDDDFDKDAEDYKAYKNAIEDQSKLRQKWEDEDEEMLIRLIKIRKSLWT